MLRGVPGLALKVCMVLGLSEMPAPVHTSLPVTCPTQAVPATSASMPGSSADCCRLLKLATHRSQRCTRRSSPSGPSQHTHTLATCAFSAAGYSGPVHNEWAPNSRNMTPPTTCEHNSSAVEVSMDTEEELCCTLPQSSSPSAWRSSSWLPTPHRCDCRLCADAGQGGPQGNAAGCCQAHSPRQSSRRCAQPSACRPAQLPLCKPRGPRCCQ